MKNNRYTTYLVLALVVCLGGFAVVMVTGARPKLGLDLAGGTSVILHAKSSETVTKDVLDKTASIIEARVNASGVTEATVTPSGSNDIIVEIPAVKNADRALKVIGTTAQLTFRQVEQIVPAATPVKKRPALTKDASQAVNDKEVVYPSSQAGDSNIYKLAPAVLTGDVVTKAEAVVDPTSGNWSVSINMNSEGSKRWATFTSRLACLRDKQKTPQDQVAIVLDGKVASAAGMQSPAGGTSGVVCGTGITGGDTQINVGGQAAAKNLALVLQTGALPITLQKQSTERVSPSLGRDSLDAGIQAGLIGLGLVLLYVLLYYRALGLIIWGGLILFSAAIFTILSTLGETAGLALSLAGIAGIIVSIGITTDSYIVAFERLKDETRSGKSIRASVERGTARALRTILVADVVTASAAVILFFLAVGAVKGFALTLGLSTLVDVLIYYFFTRPAIVMLSRTRLFAGRGFLGMQEALGAES
jgi:protein-export membrane protein SecD